MTERQGWAGVEYHQYATGAAAIEAAARGEWTPSSWTPPRSAAHRRTSRKLIETAGVRRGGQHSAGVPLSPARPARRDAGRPHRHLRPRQGGRRLPRPPRTAGAERPYLDTTSTAAGVKSVAEEGRLDRAAVGNSAAAALYGLAPLAENIEDDPDNWTRWAVVTKG
ncbi:MAG: prephenate dehydratase domain-containing protein [Dehalococcoidia bacterium]